MNKSEFCEVTRLTAIMRMFADQRPVGIDYLARSFSALIRASYRSKNEIICAAAAVPAVVQHPEFIV